MQSLKLFNALPGKWEEEWRRKKKSAINLILKENDKTGTKCIDKVITVCKSIKNDITKNDIDRSHYVGKDRSNFFFFKENFCI